MRENRKLRVIAEKKNLIWMMGYPKAGTSSIINIVERATGNSMATNYGHEIQTADGKVHRDMYDSVYLQTHHYPKGPFINNNDLPADTSNILVKTHCTAHCLYDRMRNGYCSRIPYIRDLKDDALFTRACAAGVSYKHDREKAIKGTRQTVDSNDVKKTILVARHPLAIVTSRFHDYAKQRGYSEKDANAETFREFCKEVDGVYEDVKEVSQMLRKTFVKPLEDGIPCITEFLRIMIWYDKALKVVEKKDYILINFEEFIYNLDATSNEVLDFAGFEKVDDKPWFFDVAARQQHQKDMYHWFSFEELEKIGEFMEASGKFHSPAWEKIFKHYFLY